MLPALNTNAETNLKNLPLIPLPDSMRAGNGYFKINVGTRISYDSEDFKNELSFFNDYLEQSYGFRLKTTKAQKGGIGFIHFSRKKPETRAEYFLGVDSTRIIIQSETNTGIFHAVQSLIQLLPAGKVSVAQVPALSILDLPRFGWRGMHLDVSRHFFTAGFVKKYIDYLALYKFNVFHWHLTDDQGWRIDIRKYPKLREVASKRKQTLVGHLNDGPQRYDSIPHEGYYTQQEVREIVEYAAQRHITIVPEIEMPGHAMAALAAYPDLSCTGGPFETATRWGIFEDVFCTKEETFEFLQNVLEEVCELFPGEFIHIGGDECPKTRWKNCPHCQQRMKDEGLKNEEELQAYFVRRIAKFLNLKNKRVIGWDEILNDQMPANAAIMSWRGIRGGVKAAKMDHDVVMSPVSHCYFDFYQSDYEDEPLAIGEFIPVEKVYAYEPVPDALDQLEAEHILGAQANVWTEYLATPEQVEYMVLPRMSALAEVVWTAADKKDFTSYQQRLVSHFKLLDFKGANYSKAIFDVRIKSLPNPGGRGVSFELNTPFTTGTIRYSINGDEPSLQTSEFKEPFSVDQNIGVRARVFDGIMPRGRERAITVYLNKATGKKIDLVFKPHEEYSRGGAFALVDGLRGRLPWLGHQWLGFSGVPLDAGIDLGSTQKISSVAASFLKDEEGRIYLPEFLEVLISNDGQSYSSVGKKKISEDEDTGVKTLSFPAVQARYVRLVARNYGIIPEGKRGAGSEAWLFSDEIMIE